MTNLREWLKVVGELRRRTFDIVNHLSLHEFRGYFRDILRGTTVRAKSALRWKIQ